MTTGATCTIDLPRKLALLFLAFAIQFIELFGWLATMSGSGTSPLRGGAAEFVRNKFRAPLGWDASETTALNCLST